MKKLVAILILALPAVSMAIEPFQVSIPGPFGGSAIVSCQDVHDYEGGDFGGACSLTYDNFSTIPGYYFTGNLELGFSYIQGTFLYLDFGGSFQINDKSGNPVFTVEFPEMVTFEINLKEGKTTNVMSFGTSGKAEIVINGNPVEAVPEMLDYLLPLTK